MVGGMLVLKKPPALAAAAISARTSSMPAAAYGQRNVARHVIDTHFEPRIVDLKQRLVTWR